MESNGVMQEIRELLTSGKTALEVIDDCKRRSNNVPQRR